MFLLSSIFYPLSSFLLGFLYDLAQEIFQMAFMHKLPLSKVLDIIHDPTISLSNKEYPILPGKLRIITIVDVP